MSDGVSNEQIFRPSDEVVVRQIEGELILVPLTSGVGDLEAELFSLNDTGKAVWERLDGRKSVAEVVTELRGMYEDPDDQIESHVKGLLGELSSRGMVVDAAAGA